MPDPTDVPAYKNSLQKEQPPQQPQPIQYKYQQPQQPQYNYQQPQYNYQQPQQPQYNYRQPQQAQQPQYNYQQPQYNFQQPQQYNYQQPPYGYRQPQDAAVTHTRAIGSMVMMIIALSLLAYPLSTYILRNITNAFESGGTYSWLVLVGHLNLAVGLVLMLVGAIIGSRGHALFGIGLLLCLVCQLVKRVYFLLENSSAYGDFSVPMLLLGIVLVTGTILAAIGCLARVKALKIVGGILMLVNFILVRILYFAVMIDRYGSSAVDIKDVLYFLGCVFLCIAVLAFPIRKPKN